VKWKISGWFPSHPRNPIRENINSIDNPRHQIFLKNNFTGNFSKTSTKDLSTKRNDRPVRNFPKTPHRTFHKDSCIQATPYVADPEKQKLCQPLIKKNCANFVEFFQKKF
jgi:hypothetical protein